MMAKEDIQRTLKTHGKIMRADGLDDAIIGVATRPNMEDVLAYDVDKIIEILMKRDGMSYEEAYEFYGYNIASAWVGETTPVFIDKNEYFIQEIKDNA